MRSSFSLGLFVCLLGAVAGWSQSAVGQATAKAADSAAKLADKPADKKAQPKPEKALSLAGLKVAGALSEGAGLISLFASGGDANLTEVLKRLDKAAKDDKLFGVVISLRDAEIGLGKANELRSAIAQARRAGKRVYADAQDISGPEFLVACACDEIIVPPSGGLMIPGLRAEISFYKGLFDKLGVKAEFMQMGKFKGAAEPMTRDGMSPEFRQQYEAVINDYYELLVETIAADRRIDPHKVRELIDQGLFTAEEAKAAGLVDRVAYFDEFRGQLQKQLAADKLAVDDKYGEQKTEIDLSGIGGMLKMMEIMMGSEKPARTSKNPKIAVVYAIGPIMTGDSDTSFFGEDIVGSETIVKALQTAEKDATVKGIVLRIDSPGGSALASDLIWREVTRIEKPVIASMGDTAASGGYYIAMGADKIFAEPGTLTGSIGVVGGKIVTQGLFDKVGVKTEIISRGRNSGIFSSSTSFTDSERAVWTKMMETIYKQFTTKAAAGRKMDVGKLEELAQGRVWTGRQAKQNGLVDALGTLHDAIVEAKLQAGMKADEKVEILVLPKAGGFLEKLFGGDAAESRLRQLAPELTKQAQQARLLQRLFREPCVTILPYRVEIK